MQIEKQIENKIVKGWNQMINDLTPKVHTAAPSSASTIDGARYSVDSAVAYNKDKDDVYLKQDKVKYTQSDSSKHQFSIEPRCRVNQVFFIWLNNNRVLCLPLKDYYYY